MRATTRCLALLVAGATLGLVGGCSSDETGDAPSSPTSQPAPDTASEVTIAVADTQVSSPASAVAESTSTADLLAADVVVSTIHQEGEGTYDGALADLVVSRCEQDNGVWRIDGDITNPLTADASYRVFIALLDANGATMAHLEQPDIVVKAAQTSPVSFSSPAGLAADLHCVLRVERRAVGQ